MCGKLRAGSCSGCRGCIKRLHKAALASPYSGLIQENLRLLLTENPDIFKPQDKPHDDVHCLRDTACDMPSCTFVAASPAELQAHRVRHPSAVLTACLMRPMPSGDHELPPPDLEIAVESLCPHGCSWPQSLLPPVPGSSTAKFAAYVHNIPIIRLVELPRHIPMREFPPVLYPLISEHVIPILEHFSTHLTGGSEAVDAYKMFFMLAYLLLWAPSYWRKHKFSRPGLAREFQTRCELFTQGQFAELEARQACGTSFTRIKAACEDARALIEEEHELADDQDMRAAERLAAAGELSKAASLLADKQPLLEIDEGIFEKLEKKHPKAAHVLSDRLQIVSLHCLTSRTSQSRYPPCQTSARRTHLDGHMRLSRQ